MILKEISVTDIHYPDDRIREDMGDISALAQSFRDNEIIQTIAVVQIEPKADEEGDPADQYKYRLIAGGHRYFADIEAGIEKIPARIFEANLSKLEEKSIELYENIHRKELTYGEEILLKSAIHKLQIEIHGESKYTADKTGWSKVKTAELLGETPANLNYDLELAEAAEQIPELLEMKDKAQARKTLQKMKEKLIQEELAKRVTARQDEIGVDAVRRQIIDKYIVSDFFTGVKKVESESVDFIDYDSPLGRGIEDLKMGDGSERQVGISSKQDYERM